MLRNFDEMQIKISSVINCLACFRNHELKHQEIELYRLTEQDAFGYLIEFLLNHIFFFCVLYFQILPSVCQLSPNSFLFLGLLLHLLLSSSFLFIFACLDTPEMTVSGTSFDSIFLFRK